MSSSDVLKSFATGCASGVFTEIASGVVKLGATRAFDDMKTKQAQRMALRSVNNGNNVTNRMMATGNYVDLYTSRFDDSVSAVCDFGFSLIGNLKG